MCVSGSGAGGGWGRGEGWGGVGELWNADHRNTKPVILVNCIWDPLEKNCVVLQ